MKTESSYTLKMT